MDPTKDIDDVVVFVCKKHVGGEELSLEIMMQFVAVYW